MGRQLWVGSRIAVIYDDIRFPLLPPSDLTGFFTRVFHDATQVDSVRLTGLIHVRHVDRLPRFLRGYDEHVWVPPHLRWCVRPHSRSDLFVLLPSWDDAIEFATHDRGNLLTYDPELTENG